MREASNRKSDLLRSSALAHVRERYAKVGPTLAAEYLADRHVIEVSRETLRIWMVENGIWTIRKVHRKRMQQRRARRECRGRPLALYTDKAGVFWNAGPSRRKRLLVSKTDDALTIQFHGRWTSLALP